MSDHASNAGVLGKIADAVKLRLDQRKSRTPRALLEKQSLDARAPHPFKSAFTKAGMHAIAEVKFKSPALGKFESPNCDRAIEIARGYFQAGATGISILTEEDYFNGHLDYLKAVRAAVPQARLLMKDFVIDEYQILEARVHGADCILLIVALLGIETTKRFMQFAKNLGLSVLVEVHDETELAQAEAMGAELIGINNRNLKTLEVSLETGKRLISKVTSSNSCFIAESGIKTRDEVKSLKRLGFSGILVGSAFMTSADPGKALAELMGID